MAALVRSRLIIYAKRELAMSIPHSDRCVESAQQSKRDSSCPPTVGDAVL
ncbi:hypothetical protein T08_9100 [Trichinella sp. T8]|nr:hypothetical protein T08_9100 [Trichinella sp. T8]